MSFNDTQLDSARFAESYLKRHSEHTQRAYRQDLEELRSWLKEADLDSAVARIITAGAGEGNLMLEDYERWLVHKRALAHSTVRRRIAAIRGLIFEANRRGITNWKPTLRRVKDLSIEQKRAGSTRDMSGPSSEELDSLMESLRIEAQESPTAARDLAMISLLHNPMLRRAELTALNVSDIKLERGRSEIKIVGKGRKESEKLPIADSNIQDIAIWLKFRMSLEGEALFLRSKRNGSISAKRLSGNGLRFILNKLGLAVMEKRLNPHGLRHRGITDVAHVVSEQGLPLNVGMKLSRHKKAENFCRYVDIAQDDVRKLANLV